jgi:uncharacterized beta-barrel protein YwiB (DUF1934 family)
MNFMEKEVIISIRGAQSFEDLDDDVIELVTSGTLSRTDTGYHLSYQETELTGLGGTTTTFHVETDRKVTLIRLGEVNSQMVFEEQKKHISAYETPYGAMTVGVAAHRVSADLSETGGTLEIDYALEIDHAIAGENHFRIQVRMAEHPSQPRS